MKWEYKLQEIEIHLSPVLKMARWGVQVPGEKRPRDSIESVEAFVDELGADGWELVTVVSGSNRDGIITKAVMFFKRPLAEGSTGKN
jgi:hypothetical protein